MRLVFKSSGQLDKAIGMTRRIDKLLFPRIIRNGQHGGFLPDRIGFDSGDDPFSPFTGIGLNFQDNGDG